MPTIAFRQGFQLPREEARKRLGVLLERFSKKYHFTSTPQSDDRMMLAGRGARGFVELLEAEIAFELKLPFFLAPLQKRIERGIRREVARALADVTRCPKQRQGDA